MKGDAKGALTERPRDEKHAQLAKGRPISEHKRGEMLKERCPRDHKRKKAHNKPKEADKRVETLNKC